MKKSYIGIIIIVALFIGFDLYYGHNYVSRIFSTYNLTASVNNKSSKTIQKIDPREQVSLSAQVDLGFPIRLKIPKIKADAIVEYVGLTPEGRMDVPKGPAEVAWYKLGPRPGEIGSAVIAGHSGWKNNKPAVFDNLNKLKKGDKIYIEDEKGTIIIFVVREKRLYDPNADATEVFSSSDEKAHLNLVTCEGVWDEVTKSRSKRLLGFTDQQI